MDTSKIQTIINESRLNDNNTQSTNKIMDIIERLIHFELYQHFTGDDILPGLIQIEDELINGMNYYQIAYDIPDKPIKLRD